MTVLAFGPRLAAHLSPALPYIDHRGPFIISSHQSQLDEPKIKQMVPTLGLLVGISFITSALAVIITAIEARNFAQSFLGAPS